jgi:hypothetical protein
MLRLASTIKHVDGLPHFLDHNRTHPMTASPTTTKSSADTFADVKPGINLTRSFSSPAAADATPTKKDVSWREKLRARRAPEQPGKEKWRDASLSEKERWKEWHKAKDREQKSG